MLEKRIEELEETNARLRLENRRLKFRIERLKVDGSMFIKKLLKALDTCGCDPKLVLYLVENYDK